jgi:hypothetical protein
MWSVIVHDSAIVSGCHLPNLCTLSSAWPPNKNNKENGKRLAAFLSVFQTKYLPFVYQVYKAISEAFFDTKCLINT